MAIAGLMFPLGAWTALFFACVAGAAKELWDKKGHGTPEALDFAATAIGGVVGVLFSIAFAQVVH